MKRFFSAAALASLLALGQTAIAQPGTAFLNTWIVGGDGSGTGDWNTGSNWNLGTVPDVTNDDFAIINGGGTATVSSAVAAQAGGLYLGQNAGNSGTLSVSAGSIAFVGDPVFDADGGVRVGSGGTGVLQMTGGSFSSVSLSSGGEAGSLIDLSGASSVATGSASLERTTSITGAGVGFSTTGVFTLTNTHNLIEVITGASHSTIDVGTTATLAGTLSVDFSGYAPTGAETWDLLNAPTINGTFSAINVTGASFGAGQALNVRTVDNGGDSLLQLFLEQQLVLDVNRATGVVTITNPGTDSVDLDGYSVRSSGGALNPGAWSPLAGQLGAGWVEANPSVSALNELIDGSGVSTITGGSSLSLGAVYQPAAPTEFGTGTDEITFQYTKPGNGNITATVAYSGPTEINNLVLYVDPSSGDVTMRNTSPFNVEIEAYTITSDSGALDTASWNSLEDTGAEGGVWMEANPSATRVSELMESGVTDFAIHRSFDLGALVDGGAEDLTFQYLLAGEATARTGMIVYEAAPSEVALPGDYNNDGEVDAADYTVWRDAYLTTATLPGDITPGGVSIADYTVWASNYGKTLGGAVAVPEPSSLALLLTFGVAAARGPRRLGSAN